MKISVIGSGHAATHLAGLFYRAGHNIVSVYSRNSDHARKLARKVRARSAKSINVIGEADCIVLAVKDDAIAGVAKRLPDTDALVVHTSGSAPMDVLERFPNHGVLYPVQTFTTGAPLPPRIPFCIEANGPASLRILRKLADSFSGRVVVVDSHKRMVVHAAAVFVNNFTNYLYGLAYDILAAENIPCEILGPLIEETARKGELMSPAEAQTGPARRGDRKTMQAHLKLLSKNKQASAVYKLLSKGIGVAAKKRKT